MKNVNLGKVFSDIVADLIVDRYGRVEVKTRSKLSFYTDLDHIPPEIWVVISERLENETRNRILAKVKDKLCIYTERRITIKKR